MRCGLTSESRWYRSRRRRRRRCAGSVGGRPSRCADNYPATSPCPRTVRRRARSVQCPDHADCPTTHPCIRHPPHTDDSATQFNQSISKFLQWPNGPITIAIRARFEYDSSTIRLQHATRFLCARVRDRFEHSKRISGRRVLHVD